MMVPSVHLNGTSKDALLDSVAEAAKAVEAALKPLSDASPNERDYYPQGVGAFLRAQSEHEYRMARVTAVYNELMDLYYAIEGKESR